MKLISVNIGQEQRIEISHRSEQTGIFKLPARGPVRVTALGLEGDFIASKKHHGGPDQAVYVYGAADYNWWSRQLGRELVPGAFGENLTVSDLESARFSIGDRLIVGAVTLEVTAPRIPCGTFASRMGDPLFVKRFREAERPGLYCRVIQEGIIQAGDEVKVEPVRGEKVTLIEVFRDHYEKTADESTLRRLLRSPIAIRVRQALGERLEILLVKGR
ncbi:MAG: MOSC domain-containing protein [Chloroflexi bacterium]|nr:MOSC domain-containing protein [Chloroflexota bacterium]